MIAVVAGAVVVLLLAVALIAKMNYRSVPPGRALVINRGRDRTVSFTGALVLPILQRADEIDLAVRQVVIHRRGKEGVICRDNLRRILDGGLFDAAHVEVVAKALTVEQRDGFRLVAKSGTCPLKDGGYRGWYVGWVERQAASPDRPPTTRAFAFWLEAEDLSWLWRERPRIARCLLADAGVLPAEWRQAAPEAR